MNHDLHHELHQHATALRGLARDLLRCSHAAEDVTQATLHQALRQPDLRPGPLGGWLQRTLRNFVHQWRRSERRRAAREATLPAREPMAGAAEQLARRETLQAVTSAVLALDEPFQTAVFLRYFEDLPPRQIARQTGTNVATVKSRLARGLALLRARLDARPQTQQWRPALAFAFALPLGGLFVPLSGATLLVSTSTKVLLAATLVFAGSMFVYGLGADPHPAAMASEASAGPAAVAAATTDSKADAAAAERIASTRAAEPEPWLDHPFTQTLEVLVVDDTGLPVEGHTPVIAPQGCSWNEASAATGPDGRVVLTWRTRESLVTIEMRAPNGGLRRVVLQHGRPTRVAMLGAPRFAEAGVALWLRTSMRAGERREVLSSLPILGRMLTNRGGQEGALRSGLHPFAIFGHATARAMPDQDPTEAAQSSVRLWSRALDERAVTGIAFHDPFTIAKEGAAEPAAGIAPAIAGTVYTESGAEAKDTPVVLLGSSPQPLQRVVTDERGCFRFEGVVPGSFTVRAGGHDLGIGSTPVVVSTSASTATTATVQLQRGQCVRGTLRDGNGAPLAGMPIEWRALDGSACDGTKSGKDGSFAFANVPPVRGCVLAFDPKTKHLLPVATAASVLPDTGELPLVRQPTTGELRFEPCGIDASSPVAEARLWDAETGLGTVIAAPESGSEWSQQALPAASYALRLRTAISGQVARDRLWIDGKLRCDLGRIELPRHGTVRFELADAALPPGEHPAFEIDSLRPDLDLRIEPTDLPLDRTIELPVGDYVFACRHADGLVRFVRFAVKAGEETIVRSSG